MKKKLFVMTIMVGIMLMLCSCGKSESVAKLKDIPIQSEFILFDYQELKETSKLIVKAKIMDDLSKENSVIEMDTEDTDSISSAYSLRNIELLEIYGGDNADQFQSGDKLTIIDNAAIHDNNYIHIEGYEKLEKGQIYILYLSNDTASGDYSIISANNGKVEFDKVNQLQGDEFEIAVKTLVEFESDATENEKQELLNSSVEKAELEKAKLKKQEIKVDSSDISINYIQESSNTVLVEVLNSDSL